MANNNKLPIGPVVAAWLIPGGGHFLQHRWGRGVILLVSISVLFFVGLSMNGRLFQLGTGNMIESLGYLGDLCSGVLFLGTKFLRHDLAESGSPIADYGTKFLIVAGLLNVLCVLDAYDIAVGKKS